MGPRGGKDNIGQRTDDDNPVSHQLSAHLVALRDGPDRRLAQSGEGFSGFLLRKLQIV